MDRIVQATTSDATLPLSDFSNVGSLMLTNLDASNSILVDSANTYDKFPQTILPGKSILLSPATITIHYKSSAGTPSMSVTAVEV